MSIIKFEEFREFKSFKIVDFFTDKLDSLLIKLLAATKE
jgi:hypothetical protein